LQRSTAYSSLNLSMCSPAGANTRSRSSTKTLIDEDCNLLHADLISAISDNKYPLATLKHSSTIEANTVGILSPSSNLEESEKSVQLNSRLQNEDDVQLRSLLLLTRILIMQLNCFGYQRSSGRRQATTRRHYSYRSRF